MKARSVSQWFLMSVALSIAALPSAKAQFDSKVVKCDAWIDNGAIVNLVEGEGETCFRAIMGTFRELYPNDQEIDPPRHIALYAREPYYPTDHCKGSWDYGVVSGITGPDRDLCEAAIQRVGREFFGNDKEIDPPRLVMADILQLQNSIRCSGSWDFDVVSLDPGVDELCIVPMIRAGRALYPNDKEIDPPRRIAFQIRRPPAGDPICRGTWDKNYNPGGPESVTLTPGSDSACAIAIARVTQELYPNEQAIDPPRYLVVDPVEDAWSPWPRALPSSP